MGLLGTNGGLIGKTRPPGPYACSGLWAPSEQTNGIRVGQWPILADTISDLLLLYRGTNGETFIGSDSLANNTITRTGGGFISSNYAKEGTTSYYSNTTSSKLQGNTSVTYSGDFTWQCWWYPEFYQAGYKGLFGVAGTNSMALFINDDGNRPLFLAQYTPSFGVILDGSAGGAIPLNQWNHVALTRSGGRMHIWLNGELRASMAYSTSIVGTPIIAEWRTGTSYLGYIDVTQMINGVAIYTTNFTAPTAAFLDTGTGEDIYYATTSLLLHMDGTNGSTTFADTSSNALTVTPSGNAQISTAQSKFGGASGLFDGTGDLLATASIAAVALNIGDFTIEMWVRRTGGSGYRTFAATRPDSSGWGDAWSFGVSPSNELYLYSNGFIALSAASLILLDTWHHIAAVRSGTSVKLYIDGVSVATGTNSQNFNRQVLTVGGLANGAESFTGYIDELRVTKGVARYTANFTAPTAAFLEAGTGSGDSAFAYNSLLLHMDGTNGSTTFTDNSSPPKTVTANGGVTVSTAQSKFGGASAYFNSTTDSLSFADPGLGTNDFTIEMWFKTTSSVQYAQFIGNEAPGYTLLINNASSTSGNIALYVGGLVCATSGTDYGDDVWHHLALTRSGINVTIWVDGAQAATGTSSASFSGQTNFVGRNNNISPRNFVGYIDDLRITKGLARYIARFTPSNGPYTG